MKLIFIGDVVGKPGRQSVRRWAGRLRQEFSADIIIANAENSAGGTGATPESLGELMDAGVDAFTMGNHTWRKKAIMGALDAMPNIVRPINYPANVPGRGKTVLTLKDDRKLGLINVIGRVYMEPFNCPLEAAHEAAESLREETPVILVDMHAEATAEKIALCWHLEGKCSAVVGTHTHVQTADERILEGGTACITDVGMTGPFESVIGTDRDRVIKRMITGIPTPYQVAKGNVGINAVAIDIDDDSGRAQSIIRIRRFDRDLQG